MYPLINKNFKYYLLLFSITFIWGTSFFFIKQSLNILNSYEFLFLRFLVAALVISPFFIINLKKVRVYEIIWGAIIGFLLALVLLITNLCLEYLSAAKVAIYTGMSVIIISLVDTFILKKWNKMIFISVLCSIIGLIFILDFTNFTFKGGDLLGLLLSFVIALHFISIEKATHKGNSFLIGIIQIYFALLSSILTLFIFSSNLQEFSIFKYLDNKEVLFSILYTGGLATALAFVLQTICIKKVSSIKAAIIFNFEPVVGVLFPLIMAYYFHIEIANFTISQAFGFILIILSMFIIIFDNKQESLLKF